MEESNTNNKKKRIPKQVKKSQMEPANSTDINFEWDFGPRSSEISDRYNDYSKPSTSEQPESDTSISGEYKATIPCHDNDKEFSIENRKNKDSICNLPYISVHHHRLLHTTELFWNHHPLEAVTNASPSVTSIAAESIEDDNVTSYLSIATTNNTVYDNQPGTSHDASSKQFRDHMWSTPTSNIRFIVQKRNSLGFSHPPMALSEYRGSTQHCHEEESGSLNSVPHTSYPRLKSLKRAIDKFFHQLAHLIRRLKAAKGNCLFKSKKAD